DAIRFHRQELIDGALERFHRLHRKTVNQIEVDAAETQRPQRAEHLLRELRRLKAIHRLLYVELEVLNAEAHSSETELPQQRELFVGSDARIDLDADVGALGDVEMFARSPMERLDFLEREKSRRSAAPADLRQRPAGTEELRDLPDLAQY